MKKGLILLSVVVVCLAVSIPTLIFVNEEVAIYIVTPLNIIALVCLIAGLRSLFRALGEAPKMIIAGVAITVIGAILSLLLIRGEYSGYASTGSVALPLVIIMPIITIAGIGLTIVGISSAIKKQ